MAETTMYQENYAADLVEQLREAQNVKAEAYARQVAACSDRLAMSQLISQMRQLTKDVAGDTAWAQMEERVGD
jgi:hypothetical protein